MRGPTHLPYYILHDPMFDGRLSIMYFNVTH